MHVERLSATFGRTPFPLRDHDWTIHGPIPEPGRLPVDPDWRRSQRPSEPGSRQRRRGPHERRAPVPLTPPEDRCWLI